VVDTKPGLFVVVRFVRFVHVSIKLDGVSTDVMDVTDRVGFFAAARVLVRFPSGG
jgi:hypothetical protein